MNPKILVVDPINKLDEKVYSAFRKWVNQNNYDPVLITNLSEAERYLSTTNKGVQNHRNVALIISEASFEDGNAYNLMGLKNKFDPLIPFVSYNDENAISLNNQESIIRAIHKSGLDQELGKSRSEYLPQILDRTLVEKINSSKPPVLIKKGGSADDHNRYTNSKAYAKAAKDIASFTGSRSVYASVGAGQLGNVLKEERDKYSLNPDIQRGFPLKILDALFINMKRFRDYIYDESFYFTPGQFTGRESLDVLTNASIADINGSIESLESILNQDKVKIIGAVPRHMLIGYEEFAQENNPHYPLLPIEDSDMHTLMIAKLLGLKHTVFLKRVDAPYLFDPYFGHDKGATEWIKTQRGVNKRLESVTYDEVINKELKNGQGFSLIGADDNKDGHCIEPAAAEIARHLGIDIALVHIDPVEMYPDGKHVVTGEMFPENHSSDTLRKSNLDKAINEKIKHFTP